MLLVAMAMALAALPAGGSPEARFLSAVPAGVVTVIGERGVFMSDATGTIQWRKSLPEGRRIVAPAVGDATGRVYLLTEHGAYVLSRMGDVVWHIVFELNPGSGLPLTPRLMNDGTLVVVLSRHEVVAVQDGKLSWRYVMETGVDLIAAPAVDAEDNVYLASRTHVTALDARGKFRWRHPTMR